MNSYELSRAFWDFTFANPDIVKPYHVAIYFFSIEHCNRLGWKEKFGFPTSMVMEATGMKSYSSYKKYFDDLVKWKFFKVIQYSKNQFSSNIIALTLDVKPLNKALDKALIKHASKQRESTGQSIDSVSKQLTNNKEPLNKELSFEIFWNLYNKKVGKPKCLKKWENLLGAEKSVIMEHLPKYIASTPDVTYRKNPYTYLNQQGWLDEIVTKEVPHDTHKIGHVDYTQGL